jgi:hypothetical protein
MVPFDQQIANVNHTATLPERIVALEATAASYHRFRNDVESRLRRLERAYYLATGLIVALQIALRFF